MLSFVRSRRAEEAFTALMVYLAARDPFRAMPAGLLVDSARGAVQRGHYVLAVEGGRVVGVTLWAVSDEATAERWVRDGVVPPFEATVDGDTVVLMLGGGDHPAVALGGIRHIARRYPGRRYLMNRFGRSRTSRGRFPPAEGDEAGPRSAP